MIIIGINAYHADSSACLVINGKLISAIEEERFNRIKHWAGFPVESIKYCLKKHNIDLSHVDCISLNTNPNFNFLRKLFYVFKNKPSLKFIYEKINNKNRRVNIKEELFKHFPNHKFNGEVHYIEHHISHIASAHLNSNFNESVGFSLDGFGDFSSSAWGTCLDKDINIDHRVFFPHSMGIFYQSMTQFLGFPKYGDEYKVMGLAPYGKPTYLDQMRELVVINKEKKYELNLKYFIHHKEIINYQWSDGKPNFLNLFNKKEIEELLKLKQRNINNEISNDYMNLANSIQARYEEVFFEMLNHIYEQYKIPNLSLAGGCAMNSVANGKIFRKTKFKQVYIPASAGDAGGAIGSAFIVDSKLNPKTKRFFKTHAYLGPSFSNGEISKILKSYDDYFKNEKCELILQDNYQKLLKDTAKTISEGKVVGWFQGSMEWGPRALGARSIIADPRNSNMKNILNSKIKRRESFRPFAPSILREKVDEWFEEDFEVPFMMQVFQIRENKRSFIPAVSHNDGSGRLQTVRKSDNSKYYDLIDTFYSITDVPILLNTSFNENEPIVCRPQEAIETFLRTKMDLLVIEDWMISRI